jgi:hypothetical protein
MTARISPYDKDDLRLRTVYGSISVIKTVTLHRREQLHQDPYPPRFISRWVFTPRRNAYFLSVQNLLSSHHFSKD